MTVKVLVGLTFLYLCCTEMTNAARILVLSPLGPRSHIHAFMPLVEELANRGHSVTVLTAYTPTPNHPNIRKIVMSEMLEQVDVDWYDFKKNSGILNALAVFKFFVDTETVAYRLFMANDNVKEFMNKREVDLVIVDGIVNEFTLPFVDYLQVPFVAFDPGSGTPWNGWSQGVSKDYAFIPPGLGDFGTHMTFFQRLTNMIGTELVTLIRKYYVLSALDRLAREDFPNARPIAEIEKSAALCFVNTHPTTFWNRNLPATLIPTSAMHVRPAQSLPKVLTPYFAFQASNQVYNPRICKRLLTKRRMDSSFSR